MARILGAEAQGRFDTRVCVLGHLQQGGRPSPRDRLTAVRLAEAAVDHVLAGGAPSLVGLQGARVEISPVGALLASSDRANRRPATPVTAGMLQQLRAMMLR